jgi:small-conductance mechanosensitive channel
MKRVARYIIGLVVILQYGITSASLGDLEKVSKQLLATGDKKIFLTEAESKKDALQASQKEKLYREQASKDYLEKTQGKIAAINNQREQLKEHLIANPDDESFVQKLTSLDEHHDVIKKSEQVWKQTITLLDQQIKEHQDYFEDPDAQKFKQSRIGNKQIYSFDDLQNVYQAILDKEKQLEQLLDQEKNSTTELENKKRAETATLHDFKKKKEEHELLLKEIKQNPNAEQKLNEVWQLQEELFESRKALDKLEVDESAYKLELIKLKLFSTRRQLEVLKKLLREIKPSVRVSEADISLVRDELAKKKQQANVIKRDYYQEIEKVEGRIQQKKAELEKLSRRYNIALDQDLDQWRKEPKMTIEGYQGLVQVGTVNDQLLLLQRRKDYLKALLDLEDEKIRHQEIGIKLRETFYKIRYRKFSNEEELTDEIKKYDLLKSSLKASQSSYQEKKNGAMVALENQKKAQDNLKQLTIQIRDQKNVLFKEYPREYNQLFDIISISAATLKEQLDSISKIIAVYTDTIAILTNTTKQIEFITAELGAITIWHRPEHAVSWEGLNKFVPDVESFVLDLRSYFGQLSLEHILHWFSDIAYDSMKMLFFSIKLCILLVALFLLRAYLPRIMNKLRALGNSYSSMRVLSFMLVFLGGFFIRYFNLIVIWLTVFASLIFYTVPDPYFYILFYLASIVYLLYLAQRFMSYFVEFNTQHNYVFINKEFQSRFVTVFSILLYATIIIVFFREAFILGNYQRSELPTILLAINFIILQIALISLISKEQILSLIPHHNEVWQWVYKQVDRYYYLLVIVVIAIIVMSNPYVGFGRLVLYILRRFFYTIGLMVLLIWIHQILKQSSSHLFFSIDEDDVTKERFSGAKTWYGLTVIVIFLAFTVLGLIFAAKIWNWPEQVAHIDKFADIKVWLEEPLTHADKTPISAWTIIILALFIVGGIGIALAVNRFVLGRIFDILLVDAGIQNTVSSIVYYFVLITAIFLGFNAVSLGGLVIYILGALILGIGWVIKDPISDFVAYFVILVQRPLKVGDFVKIDDELLGVVRKITPRTVILRRKNSISIVLPNSFIINKPLKNWNYVRGFIAHDDIIITISYKADPAQVQKIFYEVLAENPYVLKNPKPVIRLDNFTPDGFVFMVRGFLSSNYTLDQWDIASDIRIAITKALRAHNIEIAVPTRILVSLDQNGQQRSKDSDKKSQQ